MSIEFNIVPDRAVVINGKMIEALRHVPHCETILFEYIRMKLGGEPMEIESGYIIAEFLNQMMADNHKVVLEGRIK